MLAPAVFGRLKRAVREAVSVSGGVDGAAATVEKSRSLAGNWNNLNKTDTPNLADALALDEVSVAQQLRPAILTRFAAELGHIAIRLPDPSAVAPSNIHEALIDASAEFGDISAELREATRDHKVCANDCDRIIQQIDEAQASLGRLRFVVGAVGQK